jgi:sugar phosphate permease
MPTRRNDAPRPAYRWVVLAVLWLTLLVSYFDRVAIATALPFMKIDLGLSPTELGLVSGALLLSYTLVQVPAGYLSDRFGQRRLIAVAIAWWTVFSVLTGAVGEGVLGLLAIRFLMGAGEGFHPPALWRMLSNWFPVGRRSLPLALMLTALTLGPALAPSVALPVVSGWGWRWVFFLTAVPGVITVVLVVRWLRDSPTHADLTERTAPRPAAARRNWRVPHIWLTFAAFFFFGFVLYGLMSWLPTWLISYRGLDLTATGVLSTTPYIAGTVGLLVGAAVCQRWFNGVRRRFIAVGYLLTAACIVATVLAPNTVVMGVFLTLAGFFLYSGLGPFWSLPMDVVAPHEVGTWLGFINMGTQIAGFVGPVLIGALLQATGSFTPVLLAMIVSMVLAAVCLGLVRAPVAAPDPAEVPA